MYLILMVLDRDIFAKVERMCAEPIARFVVVSSTFVVKHPTCMLRSTWLVNKAAILVLFAVPKSVDAAMLAVLLPECRIDVASGVERSHELIAAAGGSFWKLLRSGEIESYALEHVWQCRRSISFGRRSKLRLIRHVGTVIDPRTVCVTPSRTNSCKHEWSNDRMALPDLDRRGADAFEFDGEPVSDEMLSHIEAWYLLYLTQRR
jgi:hypothetical protein